MCLEEGKVLEIVQPGREQLVYLGDGGVYLGDLVLGKTIQINYKRNFIRDSFAKLRPTQ